MALKNLILILFILIALVSFFYKIYLQIQIKNPAKKISALSVFFRFYNITDLFPMRTKYVINNDEIKLRKKANTALMVFYFIFLALIISSLV